MLPSKSYSLSPLLFLSSFSHMILCCIELQEENMLIALVLVALLFILGLFSTFLNFPTKKFTALLQSFSHKPPPNIVTTNANIAHEMVKKKGSSSSSAQFRAELKSVFATFDKNKDGYITKQELRESLKNIGISMTERDVADTVEKVDANGDGLIDLDEFCELFESMASREEVGEGGGKEDVKVDEDGEGEMKEAFDVFDGDGDGLITVEELGLVLSSLGFKEGKKLEDCKEMIRKVDMDGDGMVNFDEFKKMMKAGGRLLLVS